MASLAMESLAGRLDSLQLHKSKNQGVEVGFREIKGWLNPHKQHFDLYADWFNRIFDREVNERTRQRFGEAIEMNHMVSLIISSQEFEEVIAQEKELRGKKTTVGISKCIDGRLSTIHAESRVFKSHETMAGIIETEDISLPNGQIKTIIKSERLVEAIKDEVKKGPLLEILLAHTDVHNPNHGCGAMMKAQTEHPDLYPEGTDLVLANLQIHNKAARAIDEVYNEAAEYFGTEKQSKTAITGVYDTHTLGVTLGYDNTAGAALSTTEIAWDMARNPKKYLQVGSGNIYMPDYYPGAIQNHLLEPEMIIKNEDMILNLSKQLLQEDNEFYKTVSTYIQSDSELSQLSAPQQQALRFYLARNTALQYLSRSYEGVHPFVDHNEILQSVSSDGVSFGQFLPEQIFCANPNDSEVVEHIMTQCALMNTNHRIQEKPFLLFVSGVLSTGQDVSSSERAKAKNLAFYKHIINDPKIRQAIKDGILLPIPVLINDKNRDIVALQDPIGAI